MYSLSGIIRYTGIPTPCKRCIQLTLCTKFILASTLLVLPQGYYFFICVIGASTIRLPLIVERCKRCVKVYTVCVVYTGVRINTARNACLYGGYYPHLHTQICNVVFHNLRRYS